MASLTKPSFKRPSFRMPPFKLPPFKAPAFKLPAYRLSPRMQWVGGVLMSLLIIFGFFWSAWWVLPHAPRADQIVYFREPATFWRMFFLITLIGSIIGLKAVTE